MHPEFAWCVTPGSKLVAILIVEDEPLLRLNISDELELHGYEVLQSANADDAIKI